MNVKAPGILGVKINYTRVRGASARQQCTVCSRAAGVRVPVSMPANMICESVEIVIVKRL